VKSFSLEASGGNVDIYGDNATGKTTIYDAFLWLLFDKDSLNRANFGIKTLDSNGQPMHGLEHEAEAVLEVNGQQLVLKKVFYEKWTKQRGSSKKTFTGHTTDYFVNDVPCKKSEYDECIKGLADEGIFRLLTDPRYFNEILHWQDRRKLLLEVCGDVADSDVIASDKKLSKLAAILGDKSIDDLRKIIAARKRKVNEQLERIPVRIDEVTSGMPDISGMDFAGIEKQIASLRKKQDEHRQIVARIQSGGEIAQKQKRLAEIDAELLRMKAEHEEAKQEALKDLRAKADELVGPYQKMRMDLRMKLSDIETVKNQMSHTEKTIISLRDEWHRVNDQELEFKQDTVCPTCGQSIPAHQLEEAQETALKAFNLSKAKKLESITAEGKIMAQKLTEMQKQLQETEAKAGDLEEQIASAEKELEAVSKQIEQVKAGFEDVMKSADYLEKIAERSRVGEELRKLEAGNKEEVEAVRLSIADVENQIRVLQAELAKKDQYEKAKARIDQLKAEERQLAAEYESLEQELFLTEEFIRVKVRLLEDKINGRFKRARFKLFEIQVNGGLAECCETTYEGVPYSDLNNAARINIGLDIINTLAEHYDFTAPIWIDNAEAVTRLAETRGQVIRLIVSEKDKKLRVEIEGEGQATLFKEAV